MRWTSDLLILMISINNPGEKPKEGSEGTQRDLFSQALKHGSLSCWTFTQHILVYFLLLGTGDSATNDIKACALMSLNFNRETR